MFPEIHDIREIRERLGWSQHELSEKIGVSQSAITKYENGTQVPSYTIAKKIFELLFETDIQLDPSIENLMTTKIISVMPITSLGKTMDLLKKYSLSQIPVIEDNRVYGTITETTILNLLDQFYDLNLLFDTSVREIMDDPLPIVPKNTKLREVSPLLRRFGAIIVVDHQHICGIVSKADVLNVYSD